VIKAVIDTNILVSGLISPKGHPAKILDYWQKRRFILVTSDAIIKEVERVLRYPKIAKRYHLSMERIREYVKGIAVFSEVCSPSKKISVVKDDPEDNRLLEAAVASDADFIVSGDEHLLEIGEYREVRIVDAKTFLNELGNIEI
jgi:putative PIN family toxin of toxin-antitoxin system